MFVTLAEIRAFLNIKSDDTTLDTILTILEGAATEAIKGYCRRDLVSATYEELFDLKSYRLFLRELPVTSITTVKYYDTDNTLVSLTAADYLLHIGNGQVIITEPLANQYLVTYVAGYSTIPSDIKLAVLELVAYNYNNTKHGDSRLGVTSKSRGAGGVSGQDSFQVDFVDKTLAKLSKYRWVNV